MKMPAVFFLCLVLGSPVFAEPVVNNGGVVNGASFLSAAQPHSGIAQGSIFAVFGSDLGPADIARAASFPLPTELAGTSVRVISGGATLDAFLLYTTARQVGAILPSVTPPGTASLTVTYNGETSAAVSFQVVQSTFGILTANSRGSGPAVAQYPVLLGQVTYNNPVTPAFPGDSLTLWGTGLGPISAQDNQAPQEGNLSADVSVLVGGQPAEVQYRGRSPCCAGVDQINIVVPPGAEGCYVPIVVEVNGVPSNFATIAVSTDVAGDLSRTLPCSDPNGFSSSEFQMIENGGSFHVGTISLTRLEFEQDAGDTASATFGRWDASTLLQGKFNFGAVAAGHCVVSGYFFDAVQPLSFPLTELLDAGISLTLSGPGGTTQLQQLTGFQQYDSFGIRAPSLSPGPYTVTGPGGADVGSFQANITIPSPAFDWNDRDSIRTIPRSQDLLITWSGGDPSSLVEISGYSNASPPFGSSRFQCTANAAAGWFTVPAAILSLLPPSSGAVSPSGVLSVGNTVRSRFQATGMEFGIIEATSSFSREVTFQ